MSKLQNTNPRLGTVGGQAVLEGVMMKGKEDYAIAVRREDGSISLTKHRFVSVRSRHKLLRLPIVRGIVGFVESMILSFKTLSVSAEEYGLTDEEPEGKVDKWITEHLGDKLMSIIMGISTVLGVVLAVGLFLFLPAQITKWIEQLGGISLGPLKNLIEGLLKIALFIGYILLVSLMKDIRRTFEYHGAEHKSIFCYESGEELTVQNVKKQRRFHPRCGTSFIFVILIVSILVNSLPFVSWDNMLLRVATKLLLLPLIVGIGFEFIMYAGKHENLFTKICSAPGLWMQRITTREPDEAQIECAILALKAALPDVFPPAAEESETGADADGASHTDTASDNDAVSGIDTVSGTDAVSNAVSGTEAADTDTISNPDSLSDAVSCTDDGAKKTSNEGAAPVEEAPTNPSPAPDGPSEESGEPTEASNL